METKNTILQEVAQISQDVANIGNHNVYTAPAGYFDNLPAQVLAKVTAGNVAVGQVTPMPYNVPDGYFDGLAGNIMAKIKAQGAQQKNDIFFDAVIETQFPQGLPVPYSVPQGYFADLADKVIAKIKIQHNTVEADLASDAFFPLINAPYTVPQGYFNSLAGTVLAKIKAQQNNEVFAELEQIAPLLNTISRQMPYSVPQGYFEEFTVNTTVEETEAKVITMNTHSRRRWVTWAAAACVAVLAGIGAFLYNNHSAVGGGVTADSNKTINVDQAIASVSTSDISDYLNSQPSTGAEVQPTSLEDDVPDVQTDIDETSTQDIQQYLKDNSEPDEKQGKDI